MSVVMQVQRAPLLRQRRVVGSLRGELHVLCRDAPSFVENSLFPFILLLFFHSLPVEGGQLNQSLKKLKAKRKT